MLVAFHLLLAVSTVMGSLNKGGPYNAVHDCLDAIKPVPEIVPIDVIEVPTSVTDTSAFGDEPTYTFVHHVYIMITTVPKICFGALTTHYSVSSFVQYCAQDREIRERALSHCLMGLVLATLMALTLADLVDPTYVSDLSAT